MTKRKAIQRKTIQSSLVLAMVRKLHNHATADEVYNEIVEDYPTVSRGTVYRNLQRLCDAGEIRRLEIPGGADCFDHLCHNHYHARCIKCGRVFDVDMEHIPNLEKRIRSTQGFIFTGHDIVFSGICPNCKDTQENNAE